MIKKKKQLEIALQSVETFKNPKVDLEQYQTPAKIAADLLWNANALGDIEGLKVADLACGTGIFSIGAALLGAFEVVGVDLDPEAVEIARWEASHRGLDEVVRFETLDVSEFNEEADTVIQNPPFGAQKAHRKEADRIFMDKSLEVAPVVYSFHILETEEFVKDYFQKLGGEVTNIFRYSFPLPKIYDFHQKEEVEVDVVVLRVERVKDNLLIMKVNQ
ncbi:MAG: methyltransferase [Methanobacteriaceae archaeon]|nr:methyltransferase [Methanobacteriaceae archaeon]